MERQALKACVFAEIDRRLPEFKDLLRDIYIGVESLRNSMGSIIRNLGQWIGAHVDSVPAMDVEGVEQFRPTLPIPKKALVNGADHILNHIHVF